MPQPIPVDVLTSWTDIASVGIDSIAAIGTVGALLIAAKAYSRQVDDASRRQASQVVVRAIGEGVGEELKIALLEVENTSDQPVVIRGYRSHDDYELIPNGG